MADRPKITPVALAADPAWPPADRCSVPGFAALSAQCSALTASVSPIVVTKRDVGGFDNVNMSALDTLDEARAVLKGTSAVNAMKGMRSESTEYYNSSLANMMITFCYLTSTAEDLDRIAFAVLTFLGFLLFFIMRCFCNRCGGRDPVERGYTWCGVMTPGVAFFIFSVVIFICSAAAYVQNNTVTALITNLNMHSKNLLTPLRAIQDLQGITTAQVQSVLADTSWVGTGARQLQVRRSSMSMSLGTHHTQRRLGVQAIGENFDATYTSGFPTTCIQNGDLCLTCPGVICGGTSVAPKTTLTAWRDIADQLESTFRMTRETVYTGATTVFSAADDAEDALTIVATATSDSGATVASVQSTFDNISYTRSGLVLSIFILGLFVAFLGMAGFLKGICKDKTKWVHLLHVSWGLGVILCIISFVVASCLIAVSAVWFDGCQYLDMVMNDMTPYFSAETSRVVGACIKGRSLSVHLSSSPRPTVCTVGTSTLAALGMASMHAKSCEITERYRVAKQV
ncbi:hypothetical protein DYB32_004288 [Aphanomyces invadans]|uniref:Transmembrane protein n=1 Tax=Aphanomyces invadans TaxID=157072 RepID=A0A418AXZ4_9STRA|nr:hypothetical protein DYB32_004288 [Aphanomyces invadans]